MQARVGLGPAVAACCGLVLAFGMSGCSRSPLSVSGVNLPPKIEIVDARAAPASADAIRVRWAASDEDGKVSSIRWTSAPMGQRASVPVQLAGGARECLVPVAALAASRGAPAVREPELLTLWAVDDRGAASEPAQLAYFAQNIAPTVMITSPQPSRLLQAQVSSSVCISWVGFDPDGVFTQRPVKYKYLLIWDYDLIREAMLNPDSLLSHAVATNWADWDSTSAETTFVRFKYLTPLQSYLFVVTAFDEAGDYDPIWSLDKNMLYMGVGLAQALGPRISLQSPGFSHTYPSGGWFDDPSQALQCEVASGAPLAIQLSAQPMLGQQITGFRWVLDPVDPTDETPRSGPDDVQHWSEWSLDPGIELGAQGSSSFKRSVHLLYFQSRAGFSGCNNAADDFVSRGLLQYVVVRATGSREILIVDDTRLEKDRINAATGCLLNYTQAWPSATELDTFLYARGGVPWRCTISPPSGVLSTPGLFAGFSFDTLGTRGLRSGYAHSENGPLEQLGSVPLSVLADYRHVIWITDRNSAISTEPPESGLNPQSTLRNWSTRSLPNVLTTYAEMGGKVWLVGATGTASSLPWDRVNNNGVNFTRFSAVLGELAAGRMPWDAAHLRSEVIAANALATSRTLGRLESAPGLYASLPVAPDNRSTAFDPLPPTRTVASQFNLSSRSVEAISQPNFILEDVDPDPEIVNEQSVLDTIYSVVGATVPNGPLPAMTLYHGSENGQVLWTGFDIWTFKRADAAAIVNWVLQDLWGLAPTQPAPAPAGMGASPRTAAPRPVQRAARAPVR